MLSHRTVDTINNLRQDTLLFSDLQSFHHDVNKLLNDIDRPLNDEELSGDDDEELLVS